MSQLLPIIRRLRRPFVVRQAVPDVPPSPVVVGNVERAKPADEVAPQPVTPANADEETVAE